MDSKEARAKQQHLYELHHGSGLAVQQAYTAGWNAALAWAKEGQQPVAWRDKRVGMLLFSDKKCCATDEPLYLHPAPQPAIPEGWRPIETAPWEDTVLLKGPSGYCAPHDEFIVNGYRVKGWHQGEWNDVTGTHLSECGWIPTHWMPISAPEYKP